MKGINIEIWFESGKMKVERHDSIFDYYDFLRKLDARTSPNADHQ